MEIKCENNENNNKEMMNASLFSENNEAIGLKI